jgi:transcriptional regulator with XRE-family HTH domain
LATAKPAQISKQISYELRHLRVQHDRSQMELALAIDYKDGAQISKLENGRMSLSRDKAAALDRELAETTLGVTFVELVDALDLAERSRRLPRLPAGEYQLFLASPMAATKDEKAYQEERRFARQVREAFEDRCGVSVYYAGEQIERREEFEMPEIAARANFTALAQCEFFVLLALAEGGSRPSSIWVEAGYALGRDIPTLLLARDDNVLPFILETISQHNLRGLLPPVIYHSVDSREDALRVVRNQGPALLEELKDRAGR